MIYIAHRGNLEGPSPERENHPDYIKEALTIGYNVEVDVWHDNKKWWLGHDGPTYQIEKDFFYNNMLWCHAKNLDALYRLATLGVHYFWHQEDDVALTSRGYFWTYPGKELTTKSIAVMPEIVSSPITSLCAGICSDYIAPYMRGEIEYK